MADNVQHKIGRNRPPRVQITYDVEIGNAIEKQEIPFVVGIMADLSGFGDTLPADRKALKDKTRSFIEIDRDNFADVMSKIAPALPVADALDVDGNDTDRLSFTRIEDFEPDKLVKRVKSIWEKQQRRAALRDVLTKLDSNDAFYKDLKDRSKGDGLKALGDSATALLTKLEAAPDAGSGSGDVKTDVKAAGQAAKKPVADGTSGGEIGGGDRK